MTISSGGKQIAVPCTRCMPCRVNHSQEWTFRLEQEMEVCSSAHFLTLTYSDENITRNDLGHGILIKEDLQKFFKRLRYHTNEVYKEQAQKLRFNETLKVPSIRYYGVGEYGGETYRPHYHAIAYNIPLSVLKSIEQIWKHGHVKIGTVTRQSISYVTKYITKVDTRELDLMDLSKPFNVMSKGIGANYVDDQTRSYHDKTVSLYTINTKYRKRIGKYLESKIHDTDEKKTRLKIIKQSDARKAEAKFITDHPELKTAQDHIDYENNRIKNENLIFNKNNKRNKL